VLFLLGAVFAALGYGASWLANEGQSRVREQVLDAVALEGSERVLSLSHDIGIAASKRLKSGKIISLGDTTANEAARETAKTAGVSDKIRFEPWDAKKLSYPDSNFDVIFGTVHAVPDIVKELARVLKPGGRIVLHQTGDTATYERLLAGSKLSDVTVVASALPLGLGGRIFTARKPS
jgi:SAM-dependent methyltransferase